MDSGVASASIADSGAQGGVMAALGSTGCGASDPNAVLPLPPLPPLPALPPPPPPMQLNTSPNTYMPPNGSSVGPTPAGTEAVMLGPTTTTLTYPTATLWQATSSYTPSASGAVPYRQHDGPDPYSSFAATGLGTVGQVVQPAARSTLSLVQLVAANTRLEVAIETQQKEIESLCAEIMRRRRALPLSVKSVKVDPTLSTSNEPHPQHPTHEDGSEGLTSSDRRSARRRKRALQEPDESSPAKKKPVPRVRLQRGQLGRWGKPSKVDCKAYRSELNKKLQGFERRVLTAEEIKNLGSSYRIGAGFTNNMVVDLEGEPIDLTRAAEIREDLLYFGILKPGNLKQQNAQDLTLAMRGLEHEVKEFQFCPAVDDYDGLGAKARHYLLSGARAARNQGRDLSPDDPPPPAPQTGGN